MSLPEKKVKELISMMNTMTESKIPPMKPILECFEIGMNEKMLDYLLQCGTTEHTRDELQQIYKDLYGQEDFTNNWDGFWREIYEMSFLIPGEKDHDKFILATIFPGWIELSVSGPLNPKRQAIIEKFMDFWVILKKLNIAPLRILTNIQGEKEKQTEAPRMSTYLSTGSRTITLDQPLESEQQVTMAGDIYKLLERHKDQLSVMNCICRTYRQISGGGDCDHGLSIEGCINIGPLSRQLVDNGISRKLSFEEACSLIEEFERKGCIHTLFHYGSSVEKEAINICNCCNDCCLLYGSYNKGYISKVFVKSFYSPKMVDESKCVGCNKCGQYCATGATYYDKAKKKLVFDYDSCVGCGQCVTQCAFGVREMVPDERPVFAKTKGRAANA